MPSGLHLVQLGAVAAVLAELRRWQSGAHPHHRRAEAGRWRGVFAAHRHARMPNAGMPGGLHRLVVGRMGRMHTLLQQWNARTQPHTTATSCPRRRSVPFYPAPGGLQHAVLQGPSPRCLWWLRAVSRRPLHSSTRRTRLRPLPCGLFSVEHWGDNVHIMPRRAFQQRHGAGQRGELRAVRRWALRCHEGRSHVHSLRYRAVSERTRRECLRLVQRRFVQPCAWHGGVQ